MAPFVVVKLGRAASRCRHLERPVLGDVRGSVIRLAQAVGSPDHGFEDALEIERGPAHDGEEVVGRHLPVDRLALEVAQALLAERGRDPRSEDRRVDGLRQVVRRAHLDAAHHAVQFIDAGDDDDGQIEQRRIGLERRERFVAIHLRHDDVEEDDVDGRIGRVAQEFEGCPPIGRLERLVTDRPQESRQELPIEGRVVDDEDAAARGFDVRHDVAVLAPTGVFAIAAASSSGRIGFET